MSVLTPQRPPTASRARSRQSEHLRARPSKPGDSSDPFGTLPSEGHVQNISYLYVGHREAVSVWGKSNRPPPNSGDVILTPTEDGGEVPRDNPSAQRSLVCVTTPRCPMQQNKQTNQKPNPQNSKLLFPSQVVGGCGEEIGGSSGRPAGAIVSECGDPTRSSRRAHTIRDDALASCSLVTLTSPRIPPL